LFHPAAVLRNPDLRKEMEADFKRIPVTLEEVRQQRAAGQPPPAPAGEDAPPPQQLSLF
jgi:uracil-DNA glycosylase